MAGPVGAAEASDATIRGTVDADVPKIIKSQVISASEKHNRVLKALETRLSRESSSTANGANGRADIVKGLKLIVGSNTS